MKTTSALILIVALTLTTSLSAQLSGTYTIGSSGNFRTLNDAVSALSTSGMSGPVILNYEQESLLLYIH